MFAIEALEDDEERSWKQNGNELVIQMEAKAAMRALTQIPYQRSWADLQKRAAAAY